MENALKLMTMAAGIFITCILIGFSFLVLREGSGLGRTFISELEEEEQNFGEYKWTRFEGNIVSGAEVINTLQRYGKEMQISVNNLTVTTIYGAGNQFKISRNISTEASYIEPFDDYEGEVVRGVNGEVAMIKFKKRRMKDE